MGREVTAQKIQMRFWSFVEVKGPDDCWLWRKQGNKKYGNFSIYGKNYSAHKFSYELHYGKITNGLFVLHRCDNGRCVNPSHLFLGTQLDNRLDCKEKDRQAKGIGHGTHILTEEQVLLIRKLRFEDNMTIDQIRERFNVSAGCLKSIFNNITWRHI